MLSEAFFFPLMTQKPSKTTTKVKKLSMETPTTYTTTFFKYPEVSEFDNIGLSYNLIKKTNLTPYLFQPYNNYIDFPLPSLSLAL